jgi:hypothetical protein
VPPDGPPQNRRTPVSGELYVEFLRQGNAVRATAIDAATGAEASVVGPLNAHQGDLQKLAVAKLMRQLGRCPNALEEPETNKTPPGQGRGIVV